jgi:hypothetical protein
MDGSGDHDGKWNNQFQKDKYCVFSHLWKIGGNKTKLSHESKRGTTVEIEGEGKMGRKEEG